MPLSTSVDDARGQVVSVATGVLGLEDLAAERVALNFDPAFRRIFTHLFNLGAAHQLSLTKDQIILWASWTIFDVNARRAIFAPSDVAYGCSRMYSVYRELAGEKNLLVCRELDQALGWVNQTEVRDLGPFPGS